MTYEYLNEYNDTYDKHGKLIKNLENSIKEYKEFRGNYQKLVEYYYSEDFTNDMDISNRGEIPKEINQAVLTEDAIYDLMGDDFYLGLNLLDLANEILHDR